MVPFNMAIPQANAISSFLGVNWMSTGLFIGKARFRFNEGTNQIRASNQVA